MSTPFKRALPLLRAALIAQMPGYGLCSDKNNTCFHVLSRTAVDLAYIIPPGISLSEAAQHNSIINIAIGMLHTDVFASSAWRAIYVSQLTALPSRMVASCSAEQAISELKARLALEGAVALTSTDLDYAEIYVALLNTPLRNNLQRFYELVVSVMTMCTYYLGAGCEVMPYKDVVGITYTLSPDNTPDSEQKALVVAFEAADTTATVYAAIVGVGDIGTLDSLQLRAQHWHSVCTPSIDFIMTLDSYYRRAAPTLFELLQVCVAMRTKPASDQLN